ncbi:hypothetical protein DPMN_135294 [Dreissena polymorpha]|uniref:Uncharacterized protein n=1 Tax=Dreissena polymorpha TaxID=45954 RepID=A0A9D4FXC3_DREPO|nr:hypothetical protein DPMN_135294 [Dreissena polymorpha]
MKSDNMNLSGKSLKHGESLKKVVVISVTTGIIVVVEKQRSLAYYAVLVVVFEYGNFHLNPTLENRRVESTLQNRSKGRSALNQTLEDRCAKSNLRRQINCKPLSRTIVLVNLAESQRYQNACCSSCQEGSILCACLSANVELIGP